MKVLKLERLLKYFEDFSRAMDSIYPKDILDKPINDNSIFEYNYDLSFLEHPDWVKAHFPLELLYYRPKSGKLRDSKSEKVMYQNSYNVASQKMFSPDEFIRYNKKNKHKGFSIIVLATKLCKQKFQNLYVDKIKLEKFKSFEEYYSLKHNGNKDFELIFNHLNKTFPSDSKGQIRIL